MGAVDSTVRAAEFVRMLAGIDPAHILVGVILLGVCMFSSAKALERLVVLGLALYSFNAAAQGALWAWISGGA